MATPNDEHRMDSDIAGENPIDYVTRYIGVAMHLSNNPPAATSPQQPSDLKRGDTIVFVHTDGAKSCWLHGRIENVLPCGDAANVHIAHPCHRRYVTGDTNIKYDFLGRAIQISLSAVRAKRCDDDAAAIARQAESIRMQAQNTFRCHPFTLPGFFASPYVMPAMSPYGCYPRHQMQYTPYFRANAYQDSPAANAMIRQQQQFYCSPPYAAVVSSPSTRTTPPAVTPADTKKRRSSTTDEGASKRSNTPPREAFALSDYEGRNLNDMFEDWDFSFGENDAPDTILTTQAATEDAPVCNVAASVDVVDTDDEMFIAAPRSAENGNARLADGDDEFDI